MESNATNHGKQMRKDLSAIDRQVHVTQTCRRKHSDVIAPLAKSRKRTVRVADLAAFGMWADRYDMADPVACVENLRKPRSH